MAVCTRGMPTKCNLVTCAYFWYEIFYKYLLCILQMWLFGNYNTFNSAVFLFGFWKIIVYYLVEALYCDKGLATWMCFKICGFWDCDIVFIICSNFVAAVEFNICVIYIIET